MGAARQWIKHSTKLRPCCRRSRRRFPRRRFGQAKPRQRNVSQAATALENAAKKLSNDPSAGDLQAQLLALAEEATMAQAVFTRVRQSPTEFVKDVLNVQQEQFLISLEPPLVATIISWIAQGLVKDMDREDPPSRAHAFTCARAATATPKVPQA